MKTVAATAGAMIVASLGLFYAAQLWLGMDLAAAILPFVLGVGLGGAIGVRWLGARWPQPVAAALVAALALMLFIWVAVPSLAPHYGDYPGVVRDQLKWVLVWLPILSGGVFMLPLLDPLVRRRGPAPSPGKLALAAAALVLPLVVAVGAGIDTDWVGLGALILCSLIAAVAVGIGLAFTLAGAISPGAWAGCFGLVIFAAGVLFWLATDMPWFP